VRGAVERESDRIKRKKQRIGVLSILCERLERFKITRVGRGTEKTQVSSEAYNRSRRKGKKKLLPWAGGGSAKVQTFHFSPKINYINQKKTVSN